MQNILLRSFIPALLAVSQAAAQSSLPTKDLVASRVDSLIRARLAGPQGPASISVAIIRGGDTLVRQAWGTADVSADRAAMAGNTYRIGSLAKQFTAALLLRQIDRGRISLTDTLGQHLTALRDEWRGLRIEQLLNHTSGMQREYRQHVPPPRRTESIPLDTLLSWARRDTMIGVPGARHVYSNTGYLILGALVEKLYGMTYADAVRQDIAAPLGLATLGWCTAPDKRATETRGHQRRDGALQLVAADVNTDLALGAGGLCGSAGDVAAWTIALHAGRVLTSASHALMITPRGAAVSERYGFGLETSDAPWGSTIIGHTGATPGGFLAEVAWFPAEQLAVAVLYNSGPAPGTRPMHVDLARIALGK